MKIDLKNYMEERDRLREEKRKPGPVVTLSRQYGCEANKVTIKLLARIAEINKVFYSFLLLQTLFMRPCWYLRFQRSWNTQMVCGHLT